MTIDYDGLNDTNFKIGQKITCVKVRENNHKDDDYWEQHLTVGKIYKIEDIDWHFPNKVVIRSDNNKISMFMPIELFVDKKYIRKIKLNKINNNNK